MDRDPFQPWSERIRSALTALVIISVAILLAYALTGCAGRGGDSAAAEWQITVHADAGEAALVEHPDGTTMRLPPSSTAAGSSARARQPDRPNAPAQVTTSRGADGSVESGAIAPGADNPSAVLADMWWVQLLGVVLVLAGGFLILLRVRGLAAPWARVITANIPRGSGALVAGLGGALIVLPYFLEQYGWLLPVVALIGVAVIGLRWWVNYQRQATATPVAAQVVE